jgi:hypothetical protein
LKKDTRNPDLQKAEVQSLDNLLRSIYHQALECLDEIPENIRKICTTPANRPPFPTVQSLYSAFMALPTSLSTMFVVLDALDEADETVQDRIIKKIQELPFPDTRLLCTSRLLDRFKDIFKGEPFTEIKATDEDIALFVNTKIQGSNRVRKLLEGDDQLQQDIVSEIQDKAKGM